MNRWPGMTLSQYVNFVPLPYRRVAVKEVAFELTEINIRKAIGLKIYGKTDFMILRQGKDVAVIKIGKKPSGGLFEEIVTIDIVSMPRNTRFLAVESCDVGCASDLAKEWMMLENRHDISCLVIEGKFGHVNFILNPQPISIQVLDHAVPAPQKLPTMMAETLRDESFPAIVIEEILLEPELGSHKGKFSTALFPCRSGGFSIAGASNEYLDQCPPKKDDWLLIGCERSLAVYNELYGGETSFVNICPFAKLPNNSQSSAALLVSRCCKLESGYRLIGDNVLMVSWGVVPKDLKEGLAALLKASLRKAS